MRIIHLSDIHVWRYTFNPFHLANKRAVGMAELVLRRSRKFRLERLEAVMEKVASLKADHILITGDLTTTAMAAEFKAARNALGPLLVEPGHVSVLPGNHDRYTTSSVRYQQFEEWFGEFAPPGGYPWLRFLDKETAILALDATRSHISATGRLPEEQLASARGLMADASTRPRRLVVGCHYPLTAPGAYERELIPKRMKNAVEVREWLAGLGPHIFCCGHVHAAWAYVPREVPEQVCLNAGAPLLRDPTGLRPPGFLEITLHDRAISVSHHAWLGDAWEIRVLYQNPSFFAEEGRVDASTV